MLGLLAQWGSVLRWKGGEVYPHDPWLSTDCAPSCAAHRIKKASAVSCCQGLLHVHEVAGTAQLLPATHEKSRRHTPCRTVPGSARGFLVSVAQDPGRRGWASAGQGVWKGTPPQSAPHSLASAGALPVPCAARWGRDCQVAHAACTSPAAPCPRSSRIGRLLT